MSGKESKRWGEMETDAERTTGEMRAMGGGEVESLIRARCCTKINNNGVGINEEASWKD